MPNGNYFHNTTMCSCIGLCHLFSEVVIVFYYNTQLKR